MPDQSESTHTPAYEYGRLLGNVQRSVERMFEQIAAGLRAAQRRPQVPLTFEEIEARRERAYRKRIEHERELGRRFVRGQAARVRRELGLSTSPGKSA